MTNFSSKILVLFIFASLCCGVLSGMKKSAVKKKDKTFRFSNFYYNSAAVFFFYESCGRHGKQGCFDEYKEDLYSGEIKDYKKEYEAAKKIYHDDKIPVLSNFEWYQKFVDTITALKRFANINSFIRNNRFCCGSFFCDFGDYLTQEKSEEDNEFLCRSLGGFLHVKSAEMAYGRYCESLKVLRAFFVSHYYTPFVNNGRARKICRMLHNAIIFDCVLKDEDAKKELKAIAVEIKYPPAICCSDYVEFLINFKGDLEEYMKIKKIVSEQIKEDKRKEEKEIEEGAKERFNFVSSCGSDKPCEKDLRSRSGKSWFFKSGMKATPY